MFTELHNDNNHHLNTLYLRLVPEGTAAWWVYRLPALLAGIASIGLASAIAVRRNQRAAVAAALLTATSFLLIVYSSEARGYALAVFFAFACVLAAARYTPGRSVGWGVLFAISAVLGLLSHLTFLHALAGLLVWTAVRAWRATPRRLVRDLLLLHALPLGALAILYVVDLRHVEVGGGPLTSAGDIAASALALAVGGPDGGGWHVAAMLAALVGGIAAIAAVHRAGDDLWILFLVTVFVAPAVTLAIVDTGLLYERYLLVAIAFMTLSYAWLLDRVMSRSWIAAGMLAGAFVIANGVRTAQFLETGRVSVTDALAYVDQHATEGRVTLGSDHDFRIGRVVAFYRPFVSGGDRIHYEDQAQWSPGGPDWLLTHRIQPEFEPRREITVMGRYRYMLARTYPYSGVSGWHMALYQNARDVRER